MFLCAKSTHFVSKEIVCECAILRKYAQITSILQRGDFLNLLQYYNIEFIFIHKNKKERNDNSRASIHPQKGCLRQPAMHAWFDSDQFLCHAGAQYILWQGDSYFQKILKLLLCMFPNCSHCFTGFRTHFVFSVAQLLPMVIDFFGFNGNFNGKMTKINKMAKNHFSRVQNGSQSV